ncbi:hypothetical protein BAC1_01296 [uncultured bacterium]|nr:hypothetical protein BAC1_01296 [uncultured bacterium]
MNGPRSVAAISAAVEMLSMMGDEKVCVHCCLGRHRVGLVEAAMKKNKTPAGP